MSLITLGLGYDILYEVPTPDVDLQESPATLRPVVPIASFQEVQQEENPPTPDDIQFG